MKKILLALIPIITLASCNKNTLEGTKWQTTFDGDNVIIEFTSRKDVMKYYLEDNGSFSGNVQYGLYSYKNNKVTFDSDSTFVLSDITTLFVDFYIDSYTLIDGTVDNNIMHINTSGRHSEGHYNNGNPQTESYDIDGKTINFMMVQ